MPKNQKSNCIYSRKNDHRIFNKNVYSSAIVPIVQAMFRKDIEIARGRVKITIHNGQRKYSYEPSIEYKRALAKFIKPFKRKS